MKNNAVSSHTSKLLVLVTPLSITQALTLSTSCPHVFVTI